MKRKTILCLAAFFAAHVVFAQTEEISTSSKLDFTADYRFRIEQDWASRKPDGSYRTDRTRLRYRLRFGFNYRHNPYISTGMRLRTGLPHKQQDPQLTLGEGFKEFGTLPIGLEKAFFRFERAGWEVWLGKNTFPFKKQNELFWSDNVYPEGVFFSKEWRKPFKGVEVLQWKAGHFILSANGKGFGQDNFFQAVQLYAKSQGGRLAFFPAFYRAIHTPNIPDGAATYLLDYHLLHLGARAEILSHSLLYLELDFYQNFQDYEKNDSIPQLLKNQKTGWVIACGYGRLKQKGDWLVKLTYTHLERYAALDFMAQNDWTRWDYSAYGSPDGRLTNFKGLELAVGYSVGKNTKLKMRFFMVEQLVPYGINTETGMRVRLDLDIGF